VRRSLDFNENKRRRFAPITIELGALRIHDSEQAVEIHETAKRNATLRLLAFTHVILADPLESRARANVTANVSCGIM